MPFITDGYKRMIEDGEVEKLVMTDPRHTGEDGEGMDLGHLVRNGKSSGQDKKCFLHFNPSLVGEAECNGFDWSRYPGFLDAVMRVQSESSTIAWDLTELIEDNLFGDRSFWGMSLRDLFVAGKGGTKTRVLNYFPGTYELGDGTAAPHVDRCYVTVHFGSTHPGLYAMRNGKIMFMKETDPGSVTVFLGAKLRWAVSDEAFAGLPHGVAEKKSDDRTVNSRFTVVSFNSLWMPKAEYRAMCHWQKYTAMPHLAAQYHALRDGLAPPEPLPEAA